MVVVWPLLLLLLRCSLPPPGGMALPCRERHVAKLQGTLPEVDIHHRPHHREGLTIPASQHAS